MEPRWPSDGDGSERRRLGTTAPHATSRLQAGLEVCVPRQRAWSAGELWPGELL